jgi:hypothetical protein
MWVLFWVVLIAVLLFPRLIERLGDRIPVHMTRPLRLVVSVLWVVLGSTAVWLWISGFHSPLSAWLR